MTNRDSLEIMAEILNLCKKPQNKTRVMFKINLSWQMLQKYLTILESQGLLEVQNSSIRYITTPKGKKFIEKWRELIELL